MDTATQRSERLATKHPNAWFKAIASFEREFERELTLDEKVSLAANTIRRVRAHYRAETGKDPDF